MFLGEKHSQELYQWKEYRRKLHMKRSLGQNLLEVTNRSKYRSFRLGKIKSLHNPSRGDEKET